MATAPTSARRSVGRLIRLAAVLGGIAAGGAACHSDPPPPPVAVKTIVKLVSSLPRAGAARPQSDAIVNGIRLAIAEQNAEVGNFSIAYEDWDDASPQKGDWDADLEAANARRAVADPDVLFYLGPYNSGAAKVSLPVLNLAGLVAISPANTYGGLTKPGSAEPNEPEIYRPTGKITYYRIVPTDDIQGKVAAEFARYKGWKRVYVLHDGGLYGQGIADNFVATAAQVGLSLVSSAAEKIDPQAPEYPAILQRIRRLKPDAIYFGGTTQPSGGRIARDVLSAAGPQGRLLAPNGCFQTTFIKAAGADVLRERAFITFGGLPPDQLTGSGAAFVAAYRKRFKIEPEGYSVNGYVVAQVALKALAKAARKNREAVRQAMVGMGQVDGALGSWQFDSNGDTSLATISVSTVKNGRFQFVASVNPAAAN